MNVIFHVATAVGITIVATDTKRINSFKDTILPALGAFSCGIILHGALDYTPHTYPLSGTIDSIVSLLIIIALITRTKRKFLPILLSAVLGSIFPDLVDLSPHLLNRYVGLEIPEYNKIFPWHYPEYSGSIFSAGNHLVSNINHLLTLTVIAFVCWFRRSDLQQIFSNRH